MSSKVIKYATSNIIRSGTGNRLPPMPTIRDIIKIFKLSAIKQLSQNFIMDEQLTARIVKAAGNMKDSHVLEVGPGPGSITRSIVRRGPKQLVVVEKDERFLPTMNLLKEAVEPSMQMDIFRDDILKFRLDNIFPDSARRDWDDYRPPVHLIGNLPFAISTRLLINWLKDVSLHRGAWSYGRTPMTLTFQKEVGERIVAPPLGEQRCRLSVMSQIWTQPTFRFLILGQAFVPKPDVDVAVIRLEPLKVPLTTQPFDLVEKVVRHIFSMRQKYVRRCIATLYPKEEEIELTKETFDIADIDPQARSFQLSTEECLRLVDAYQDIITRRPELAGYNYHKVRKMRAIVAANERAARAEEDNDDPDDDYLKF